jgi:hypothetical protein
MTLVPLAFLAVGGLITTAVAPALNNPLIFQAQPYRILWLVSTVAVPCVFWLAKRARRTSATAGVLVISAGLWALSDGQFVTWQLRVALGACVLLQLILRRPMTALREWTPSLLQGLFISAITFRIGFFESAVSDVSFLSWLDPVRRALIVLAGIGGLLWSAAAISALMWASARLRPKLISALLLFMLPTVHAVLSVMPMLESYRDEYVRSQPDLDYVASTLSTQGSGAQLKTLYCDWCSASDHWLVLGVNSYFNQAQLVGVIFERQTAMEARRRARLVSPFEWRRYQRPDEPAGFLGAETLRRLVGQPVEPPTAAALRRLCSDAIVDAVVLRDPLVEVEGRTNGRIHIYDCRQLNLGAFATREQTARRRD